LNKPSDAVGHPTFLSPQGRDSRGRWTSRQTLGRIRHRGRTPLSEKVPKPIEDHGPIWRWPVETGKRPSARTAQRRDSSLFSAGPLGDRSL